MLFDSIVAGAVQRTFASARDAVHLKRCDQWRALHQFLIEQQREQTLASAQYSHPRTSQRWAENDGAGFLYIPIVSMYASRLSVAFDQAPQTYLRRVGTTDRLPENDPQVQQWRQDARHIKFAQTMQQVEETTTVLGQVIVSPTWVEDRVRWRVHAPYEVFVEKSDVDPDDISRAKAIGIEIRAANGERHWLVWGYDRTKRQWLNGVYDAGGKLLRHPLFQGPISPYGRHPIVVWQWKLPVSGELWTEPDEALLQLARKTNVSVTDLNHGLQSQVHPQCVGFGTPKSAIQEGEVHFDPEQIVWFGRAKAEEGLEYVTAPLQASEHRASIEWWLRLFAVARGLPPTMFMPDGAVRNLSAKQEESAELTRLRKRRYPVIIDAMRETFEVHKAVANYWAKHAGRVVYEDDIELEVELQPIPVVEDRQASAQATQIEIDRGTTSAVKLEQQDSGVSREEAIARIQRNRADQAAVDGPPDVTTP